MQSNILESIQDYIRGPFTSWMNDHARNLIIIFLVCWLIWHFCNLIVERSVRKIVKRTHHDTKRDEKLREDTLISLFTSIIRVAVWLIGLLLVVSELDLTRRLAPLAAGAGLFGIILGFGMQSLVRDLISGLFIVLENQYRVGDIVDIDGVPGTVIRISMRSTVLRDMDGDVHFIPNGNIQIATNKTLDFSKANVYLRLDVKSNLEKTEQVVNLVGQAMINDDEWRPKLLTAPKYSRITNFDEYAVEILITCKTIPSKQWEVSGELRSRLIHELSQNKIKMAAPALLSTNPQSKARSSSKSSNPLSSR